MFHLGDYSNPSNLHTCLGTILTIRHVLTAAVCVCHPDNPESSPFNLFGHRCERGEEHRVCKYLSLYDGMLNMYYVLISEILIIYQNICFIFADNKDDYGNDKNLKGIKGENNIVNGIFIEYVEEYIFGSL